MSAAVHIGTSGWHYQHWRGTFYPEKLPASKMLEHYTRFFDTVELNNTFYRLPPETGVAVWRDSTPKGFCFAAKGSRFLTHMKKLKDTQPGVEKFFSRAGLLGRKLGPIVFQFPPWWEADPARLEEFLAALPPRRRYAFGSATPPGTLWKSSAFCAAATLLSASSRSRGSAPISPSPRITLMSACTDRAGLTRAVIQMKRWRNGPREFAPGRVTCARFTCTSITTRAHSRWKTPWL